MSEAEDYMTLPPASEILPPHQKRAEQKKKEDDVMSFLERNGVIDVLSKTIISLYARYMSKKLQRHPVEYFLEILAENAQYDPQQGVADDEADELQLQVCLH